jgi:hypothetical protein
MSYAEGLQLFREQHWFEAHEVLELVWRATPQGPLRNFYQGLIQLAVSLEHWKRGNPRGAWGLWHKGRARMDGLPAEYQGIALSQLLADFQAFYDAQEIEEAVRAQAEGRTFQAREIPPPTPQILSS